MRAPGRATRLARTVSCLAATAVGIWILPAAPFLATAQGAGPCGPPVTSAIACENTLPGDPASDWQVSGSGDASIQGFTTDISVNVGGTIHFKVKTTAAAYHLDILRMGYYQGNGARKVASNLQPAVQGQAQPSCLTDSSTGLVDCGNWAESASWAVPSTAVSGIYFAHLVRNDNGAGSQVFFVVRNDASTSDLIVKTSDATWQAYNPYGGNNFYTAATPPPGWTAYARAYKLSYNRPFTTPNYEARSWVYNAEYPMVRFLEANGYDATYTTDVDADRYGSLLKNHRVFVSVGHDEYWSGGERDNVTAARDAGVNLAFFSGNEVYWKTRWEASIDGSGTSNRTLVCYKETWAGKPIDPSDPPTWTGNWRDPRFSPPADGGRPENALTGTMTMAVDQNFDLTVPAAYAGLRFWRNTRVASLTAGQSTTLAPGSGALGYEWDEDVDSGSRPAGLLDMSSTTVAAQNRFTDYGLSTAAGSSTHHLTLYRAASGALVFGAGTIYWAFGIEDQNTSGTPADPAMQQATVNILGDMGVQPATLIAGLVPATASADRTAPTSTITSPAPATTVASGTTYTIRGTATDAGGGVVAGVEVSVDGGTTWHPASGTTSWSYSWVANGGPITIRSRAVDDSANLETPSAGVSLAVTCPCSMWPNNPTPATPSSGDNAAIEVGVQFRSDVTTFVSGIRFYKGSGNTGTHVGHLWTSTGTLVASVTFANETASGWQQASFSSPVALAPNTTYVASYYLPSGNYPLTSDYFEPGMAPPPGGGGVYDAGTMHFPRNGGGATDGLYRYGSGGGFPSTSFKASNYWVDLVFTPDNGPTITSTSPPPGGTNVATTAPVSAVFDRPVNQATLAFTLQTSTGTAVPATVSYSAGTNTATLQPSSALAGTSTYTASVQASDTSGNAMPYPYTWSFTTLRPCPCTIWPSSTVPGTAAASDGGAIEVGVKVRADVSGFITGVRFYKGTGNNGTHTGHLWTASGTLLASATFTGETATGWQQVTFPTAVAATAGTTYVASYFAPVGHYAVNSGYFTAATDNAPLHAIATGDPSGPDGLYAYGGTSVFPSSSYQASNYWVDVVFSPQTSGGAAPPGVSAETPAPGATAVQPTTTVTVTFNEAVQQSSIAFSLQTAAGASVAGTSSYSTGTNTLTFTPSAQLATGATYTASVSASDTSGNAMPAPFTWSFTVTSVSCPCTIWPSTATPASVDGGDGSSIEVGVKFRPDTNGYITGVRFYKAAANTGTHLGNLWSATGTLLASAMFTSETASGWQQVSFQGGVAVTAGTVYVASYFAPRGHYSVTSGGLGASVDNPPLHAIASSDPAGPNGLYGYSSTTAFPTGSYQAGNYWVDVVFSPQASPDTTPPAVTSETPAAGSTGASTTNPLTAAFSEAVQAGSVSFTLQAQGGAAVTGAVAYSPTTYSATFTPSSALVATTVYTAAVTATDLSGQAMASPFSWSFTTAGGPACPCTIWASSTVPTTVDSGDGSAIELGVKFRSDVGGFVRGVSFYKSARNTGTHVGHLWSASGTLLATATFTSETASGWQTVTFSSPVAITAGTTYVASYYAPSGHYSVTQRGLSTSVDNAPLHAISSSDPSGPNGLYLYGSDAFPNGSYQASNYWVDVVFTTT